MSGEGWTPLFSSVFTGSMRGKPEELLVWFTLLSRKNRDGIVDCSYRCLAEDCGLSVEVIRNCIARFCEPDPESRSQAEGGAKLAALPNRGFGWRVVNHAQYRERARKQRWNEEQTASGADARRKRDARNNECPDVSGAVQISPAIRSDQIKSDQIRSETESEGSAEGRLPRKRGDTRATKRMPPDWVPEPALVGLMAVECPLVDLQAELRSMADYEFKTARSDWPATYRNWVRREQKRLAERGSANGAAHGPRESRFERMRRLNGG